MAKQQELQSDLKTALLKKDAEKASVLRFLLAEIKNREIEKGESLSEDEIDKVIKSEVKKIKDSIDQFGRAGRKDLVEKENKQLALIGQYLPEQVKEEDIQKKVLEVIEGSGALGMQDMGRVIGAVMQHFGSSAEGALVSSIVKAELSKL